MNDSRRTLVMFALAVSKGLITAEDAAGSLQALKEASSTANGFVPLTPRPEMLGEPWSRLDQNAREEFQRDLAALESDIGRAELVVITSPLPDAVRRTWWGEDPSQVAPGVVMVDIDFAMSQTLSPSGPAAPARPTLPRLTVEDRYQVQREVARGGMGRILLAKDVTLGRNVAVKEILSGADDGTAAPEDVERFLREARITGQLEHPNIVPVHELGQRADGRMYYTMKMVRGETMEKRLTSIMKDDRLGDAGKLAKRMKLLDAFVDVCQALAYAHSRGVVNRDLKPSNVMLGDFGETVVLDWGLARVAGAEDRARKDVEKVTLTLKASSEGTTGSSKLTMDGAIMGTPAYMSPEQARGEIEDVDAKSDVYSLGAILYEIVTGVAPFRGGGAMEVVRMVAASEPQPVTTMEPRAPRELEALIQRAMAKDRVKRLASARLLAEEVTAFRDGRALSTYSYTGFQQVSRWVKRHKGLTAGIAAAVLAMIAGTITSAFWARRASERFMDAQHAENRAVVLADKAVARTREAEAESRRADGLRLAAQARVQSARNPAQALWLAIRGAERAPGAETRSALYDALQKIAERRRLYGSEGYVETADFSPDGTRVAGGGDDGAVRIWDVDSGAEIRRLDGHTAGVRFVEFSPDGSRLLSHAADNSVRLWGANDGRAIAVLRGQGSGIRAEWGSRGRIIVTWGKNSGVRSWTEDGAPLRTLLEAPVAVTEASISPDERRVALTSREGVEIRNVASGALELTLTPPAAARHSRWTPDGREILTACADGVLRSWDSATGAPRLEVTVLAGQVIGGLFVSPDGTRAVVRSEKTLHFVSLVEGSVQANIPIEVNLDSACLSPDWKRFLRIDRGVVVSVINTATGDIVHSLLGHRYTVKQVGFSRDGRRVVTASADQTVGVWDAVPGGELPNLAEPREPGNCIDVDPERGLFLFRKKEPLSLHTASAVTGELIRPLLEGVANPRGRFLDDGLVVAWSDKPPQARLVDPRTGQTIRSFEVLDAPLHSLTASGRFLAGRFNTGTDQTVRVWNADTGEIVGTFVHAPEGLHSYDLSRDGSRVLTSTASSRNAIVWDVRTGNRVRAFEEHSGYTLGAVFAGDTGVCISTAVDTTCRAWETATGKVVSIMRWPRLENLRISASPDGRMAWVFGEGDARLYDVATGQRLGQVDTGFIDGATWFKDGSAAVFAYRNGLRRVIPTDPLAAARRALPRELDGVELHELEACTEAERVELTRQWNEKHPSAASAGNQGVAHLKAGRFPEATRALQAALRIYPRDFVALRGLACATASVAATHPEGSPERARLLDEALATIRGALEYGMPADYLEGTVPGLEVLKAHPKWAETAAVRPER